MTDTPEENYETMPAATPRRGKYLKAHQVLLYFVAGVMLIWLLSGFYQVKANEEAVVERLGQYLSNTEGQTIMIRSGLHYHLPWPIDRVQIISKDQTLTLVVDEFNAPATRYLEMKNDLQKQGMPPQLISALFDPYLITADKSIVNMEIRATYRISDTALWISTVSHESDTAGEPNDMRDQLFQQLAQRALVHQLSHMKLDEVLFTQRGTLPQDVLNTIRTDFEISDPSDKEGKKTLPLGLDIQKVDISALAPPAAVRPAFNDVANARQQREAQTVTAKAYADSALNNARAEMTTRIADANVYKSNRVEAARGEKDRFGPILEQYRSAPDITRWNLWVDAVKVVSGPAVRHYFVQEGQRTIITVDPVKFDAGQVLNKQ